MASSEKIISPGVFTNEIDQTFLPAAVGDIGAALVGPTVKGPPLVPTVVNSYSEFEQIFGSTFLSGSNSFSYLTSLTAREYLKNQGTLTVVRILDGNFTQAFANVQTGHSSSGYTGSTPLSVTGDSTSGPGGAGIGNILPHLHSSASTVSNPLSFRLNTIGYGEKFNTFPHRSTGVGTATENLKLTGSANGLLLSGSDDSVRWEVTGTNAKKGTFNLLVRKGNDTHKRKQILETWNNLSLDPNSNNFISKIIGDSKPVLSGTESEPYIATSGSFPNKSKYVYVSNVSLTPNYVDANGNVSAASGSGEFHGNVSSSLPGIGSGSFHGSFISGSDGYIGFDAFGNEFINGTAATTKILYYENIAAQSQGYTIETDAQGRGAYRKALNLLSNQDEYDINLLLMPGVISNTHTTIAQKAIDMVEDRADCFLVLDPVLYGSALTTATAHAESKDSNYAAMYWPWIQIPEPDLGRNVFVPPSVAMAGVYAFNDKVAHPWFAPAGLNRGGIDIAVQAERKLTQTNRDDLYESNVNPIATFPGQGVCVWGQKTLQKKASALDRVNVRRLLIKLKKFIASTSRFLVFEQNNAKTRNRFLNIVNPYMEQVQSNSGLNAFRVVMDDTNNTPDTIDRNILYGQIFVQPTRTAEFIVLDFTIQPSGATFPE
jgi:hypothetical protein